MANLTNEGFRETLPTLKARDLQGAAFTVVTIAKAPEIVPATDKKSKREKLLLMRFTEWPDRVYYPNSTSIGRLMKGLGSETEAMKGKRIALHVKSEVNPETKTEGDVLHIAPVEEWGTLIAEYDEENEATTTRPRRKRAARKNRR